MAYESAERVQDEEGRQYHIDLAPGEVGPWVLLVGDPGRVAAVTRHLTDIRVERQNREYVSATGTYNGLEVTVLGTGIGCDNTEIAVMELLNCRREMTLIRVGSCGALQPEIGIGELVISTGAVRLESTSLGFVDPGYPAVAHHEVVLGLVSAAAAENLPHHVGLTASASGFYGWQGRKDQVIAPRDPELPDRLAKWRVANFEMETSTLFTMASLAGIRAGAVCAAFANRPANQFIEPDGKKPAEARAVLCGLRALEFLATMDSRAAGKPFSLPPA